MSALLKYDKFDFDWRSLSVEDKAHNLTGAFFRMKTKDNPKEHWEFVNKVVRETLYLGNQKSSLSAETEINFSFPETGYYNFKGTAIYFSRLFTRQWKRGICNENSVFENFLLKIGKLYPKDLIIKHNFILTEKNLDSLFSSRQIPFKGAYAQIQEGKALARVVSRHILMSCGVNSEFPILWFRGVPIGEVLSPKKARIKVKIFEQEIRDLLKNENLEFSF